MENKEKDLVPQQNTGAESNTESSVSFNTLAEAQQFFEVVQQRLLNVNNWHHLSGTGTAGFQLTDAEGNDVNRPAQKGDHFKIDIPGPGPATGDGYDWVQIEAIERVDEENKDCIVVRVRPATNPNNERQDVAHFFSPEATSNFMAMREGNTVTAAVYGRNEKPNRDAEKLVDKARNTAVATGAVSGFSKLQWKSLVNGLLKQEA
jgi:hypothetical protein